MLFSSREKINEGEDVMNRFVSIIKKDYSLSLRDNIALYIIVAPLLLAFAVRLFIPTVSEVTLNFIIEDSVSSEYINQFDSYGTVELLENKERVIDRVNRTDAVAGIFVAEDRHKIIFEGNEPQEVIDSYVSVFEKVLNNNDEYPLSSQTLSENEPILYGIISIVIIMTALFLGGTVSGFNIVAEKDSGAIKSLAVAPLRMNTYIISKGAVAIITCLITGVISTMILSATSVNYLKLVLTLISSGPMAIIIALLIGRMASNQINSIAAIKVIMPVYLTLPLVSLFIPQMFQIFLYPLPNYWAFISLQHIFLSNGSSASFYTALTALSVSGIVYLFILSKVFRRHFGLR